MTSNSFLSAEEFFEVLIKDMPTESAEAYDKIRHTRIEPAYPKKRFVMYEVVDDTPQILGYVRVKDFVCNDEEGGSTVLVWEATGEEVEVGFIPTQLFGFNVFAHLPLDLKVRWSTRRGRAFNPVLSFLMVLRTCTRLSLREPNTVYIESMKTFVREFGSNALA